VSIQRLDRVSFSHKDTKITIQVSYVVRGARRQHDHDGEGYEQGFGGLQNVAVDRENDLVAVIEAHPELPGIGRAIVK